MRHSISALVVITALIALPTASRSQCPNSGWSSGPYGDGSTAPVYSSGPASWNFQTGVFQGSSSGGGQLGWSLYMNLNDSYQIVGPASATPISVRVRVRGFGTASAQQHTLPDYSGCDGSSMTVTLSSGAVSDEFVAASSSSPCQSVDFNEIAEITIAKLPLETFPVQTILYFSNMAFAAVQGTALLTFHDLPEGYSITSCKGYVGPVVVVPAVPASWGAVKNTYR